MHLDDWPQTKECIKPCTIYLFTYMKFGHLGKGNMISPNPNPNPNHSRSYLILLYNVNACNVAKSRR